MNKKIQTFGKGFPKTDPSVFSAICDNKLSLNSIAVGEPTFQEDLGCSFIFEKYGDDDDAPVRVVSDIKILLHAEDYAKRYGTRTIQSFLDSMTPRKTSFVYDSLPDDLILKTVKSRHLQSPSEILAWSESLALAAKEVKDQYSAELERLAAMESSNPDPDSSPQTE